MHNEQELEELQICWCKCFGKFAILKYLLQNVFKRIKVEHKL